MKLIVNNSESQIEGFNAQQFKQLRDILSIVIYHINKFVNRPTKKVLISPKGIFPTGLLYLVVDWLEANNLNPEVLDLRKHVKKYLNLKLDLPFKPYPKQIEAANKAEECHRGIIVAPTGSGKSAIISLIIEKLQVRTVIVVPNLQLKRQAIADLAKFFNISITPHGPILIENIDSLEKHDLTGYDCIILDEFHHSAATTYRKLNKTQWKHIYYRFGLTATPFRSQDHEKLLLESVIAHQIYNISYQDAVKDGYIVPLEAEVYILPSSKIKSSNWREVYNNLVVNNDTRNELIAELLRTYREAGKPTLCLVKEVAHGRILSELSGVPFANGIDEDSPTLIEAFSKGGMRTLIGTEGVIGEGIDTKSCEVVIIAGLGKSKNRLMQSFGRCLRKFPGKTYGLVILFADSSHKWAKEHLKTQLNILQSEYGVNVRAVYEI